MEENGRREFIYSWTIENFRYGSAKKLWSSTFVVELFEHTTWRLLIANGRGQHEGYFQMYLYRLKIEGEPLEYNLQYEISLHAPAEDLDFICMSSVGIFKKGSGLGFPKFIEKGDLLDYWKDEFLFNDTLTVTCRMWTGMGRKTESGQCSSRSIVPVDRTCVMANIKNFESLDFANSFGAANSSTADMCRLTLSKESETTPQMEGTRPQMEGTRLQMEVSSLARGTWKLCWCKLLIVDSSGNVKMCGKDDITSREYFKECSWRIPLTLTREEIIEAKDLYLPNGDLQMKVELVMSKGNAAKAMDISQVVPKHSYKKTSSGAELMKSLNELFQKSEFCDTVLKTKSKSFPAHKVILSARSSVFRAMFSTDMSEKTEEVNIQDLDSDTVGRMLQYIYGGDAKDLTWESAEKLYFAADKYDLLSLRLECAKFLRDRLTIRNVCQCLLLADTHSDTELMDCAKNYILRHADDVLRSEEWFQLEVERYQLALKTYRKIILK